MTRTNPDLDAAAASFARGLLLYSEGHELKEPVLQRLGMERVRLAISAALVALKKENSK